MIKITFRADGGSLIGMGHIMRCISLATQFRETGCKVYFISKFEEGINRVKEEGFEIIRLDEHISLEAEVEQVVRMVKAYEVQVLVIDTYNVTCEYFLKIKPHIKKLAYIDDINSFIYPVDILINGNITGQYIHYKKYSEDEIMLLGPKYNLIRDEFKGIPMRVVNNVEEIMITTGGSDPYGLSYKISSILLSDQEIASLKINVVIGEAFRNKELLRELGKQYKNIVLHENVKRISEIMLCSDIAISSGGSTLYELCACGTPTLAFIMADNQQGIIDKLNELNYIESLGWYNLLSSSELTKRLKSLINDCHARTTLSRRMQTLVDGNGTRRIIEKVLELL